VGEEAINQCAFIYVLPAGRNVIVVSPGANATLDPETAMLKLRGLGEGDFLLAQLETPMETVEAALAYAKCRGATTVLDPALKRLAAAVDAYLTRRAGVAALRAVLKLHCVADPESFLKLKRRESIALRAAFPAVVQGPIYSWLGPYWLDGE
jgi:sugar/nucleoside kinase (ribokinase family)